MAGKAPAFQFYPGDWFREPGIKCVDLSVRGAWAELLMIMWDCNPQGHKESTLEGYARLWRTSKEEAAFIIDQLDSEGIADVEYFDEKCEKIVREYSNYKKGLSPQCPQLSPDCPVYVTIINRRMLKAWKVKESERLKKQKQRAKKPSPKPVPGVSTSLSSSSTSTSTTEQPPNPLFELPDFIDENTFNEFKKHRKELKKPMTDRAAKLLVGKLTKFHESGHNPNKILETSMLQGWQGVFKPKGEEKDEDGYEKLYKKYGNYDPVVQQEATDPKPT